MALFMNAYKNIRKNSIIKYTNLELNTRLSKLYNNTVFFKREDMQTTRSFKIRGAYNKIITSISDTEQINNKVIVTASAGNHAQGVALTCNKLGIQHHVFVPKNTPKQKIDRIKNYGEEYLHLHMHGNTFDDAYNKSNIFCINNNFTFVHPFNDLDVIFGQASIAIEIEEQMHKMNKIPDIILVPVGGGGLISGIASYIKTKYPFCKIIGVEPENANSLEKSLKVGHVSKIDNLNTFADGVAVKEVGELNFEICKTLVDDVIIVSNNHISNDIIDVYQNEGIILEPAGVLSICALKKLNTVNKNIICLLSGGNNDIMRYSEMLDKKLLYQNLKGYYLVNFTQTPGELQKYVNKILTTDTDITRFEYLKKTNKNFGTVLIGVEFNSPSDINIFESNMKTYNFIYTKINDNDLLYSYLI
jgi:threonine dehydratase